MSIIASHHSAATSMSINTADNTADHQTPSNATTTDANHRSTRRRRHRRSNVPKTPQPDEFAAERWPEFLPLIRHHARNTCTTELLVRRLPIIGWTRQYQLDWLYRDILAGVTVGLTAIPQGIAYAVVAGMQPQYGLYSELIPSFVYCVLGSSRHVTIGPTAIMALLVQRFAALSIEYAVLATFLTGCLVLALGVLNLGFLVRFISEPVTVGFTTAAALQIGSLQVKSLLGLPGKSSGFVEAWLHVFGTIRQTSGWDALMGFASIGFLVALKVSAHHSRVMSVYQFMNLVCLAAHRRHVRSLGEHTPIHCVGPQCADCSDWLADCLCTDQRWVTVTDSPDRTDCRWLSACHAATVRNDD